MNRDLAPFNDAHALLAQLAQTPPGERWALPFPLAVYGTLRQGFCNYHLMQRSPYFHHCRAFLPHFYARGIELFCRENATCPFEIFCYEPAGWAHLLPPIEELEEFQPGVVQEPGYHRTLAWLYLLPDDYLHPAYQCDLPVERDLRLERAQWPRHTRVPCWVYSSLPQNRLAAALDESPLIWDGVVKR